MASEDASQAVNGHKPEKKHKKDKSEKKEKKKRAREEDPELAGETTRKHKRSKSTLDVDDARREASPDLSATAGLNGTEIASDAEPSGKKEKKKSNKQKKDQVQDADADADAESDQESSKKKRKSKSKHGEDAHVVADEDLATPAELKSSKKDKKDKKKKKHRHPSPDIAERASAAEDDDAETDDAMDVDTPAPRSTSRLHQPPDAPSDPQYPFFSQTVSLYLPLYPIGWAEPRTAAAIQHLQPMLNRYVPTLKGVLLAFRNIAVSEHPGRDDDDDDDEDVASSDTDTCDVVAIDEYAVGFGWVTVDVDLFVPKRGAWMEGSLNLQSEGHVGVVCWGKFNASIESARLPPEWRWVHLGSEEANEAGNTMDDTVSNFTAEEQHGAVSQIHATGYWVDGSSKKVKGRVRFRIKSFDVGVSGDHGFLSLEGTMLDGAGEAEALQRDVQQELRRKRGKSGGILVKERRLIPEFSVTKFGQVEDEEDKALRQDVWNTTEPKENAAVEDREEFAGITNEDA